MCPSNITVTASLALLWEAEEHLSTASQKEKLRHREGKWLAKSDRARHKSQIYRVPLKCLGSKIVLLLGTLQL